MQLRIAIAIFGAAACHAQVTIGYTAPAAHYYVDQGRGSDSNPGTPAQPFATGTKAMSVVSANQLVALSGGANAANPYTYREQVTIPANNVGIVGWGIQPVIAADDAIPAGSWAATGGGAYQVTSMQICGGVSCLSNSPFGRLYENGIPMTVAASLSACNATAGSYWFSSSTVSPVTICAHPADGSTPATNGKSYEYTNRNVAVEAYTVQNPLAANVVTRRAINGDGSMRLGQFGQAVNTLHVDGSKHNLLVRTGTSVLNTTALYAYNQGQSASAFIVNENTPNGEGFSCVNCTATMDAAHGDTGNVEAMLGHSNAGGQFGLFVLTNFTATNTGTCADGPFTAINTATCNHTQQIVVSGSATGSQVISSVTFTSPVTNAFVITSTGSVELASVTAACNVANGCVWVETSAPASLSIHDSTLSNAMAFDGILRFDTVPAALTLMHNTFLSPAQTNYISGSATANLPTGASIDQNVWHYPNASSWINWRGTAYDVSNATKWANWQALGFDANGSRVNSTP